MCLLVNCWNIRVYANEQGSGVEDVTVSIITRCASLLHDRSPDRVQAILNVGLTVSAWCHSRHACFNNELYNVSGYVRQDLDALRILLSWARLARRERLGGQGYMISLDTPSQSAGKV